MQKANQMRTSSLQLKTSLEKHMQISWYRRFDFFITSSADYPKGFCKRNRNAWLRFLIFPAALQPLQPLQPLTAYYDRERNSLSLFRFPESPMLASFIFRCFSKTTELFSMQWLFIEGSQYSDTLFRQNNESKPTISPLFILYSMNNFDNRKFSKNSCIFLFLVISYLRQITLFLQLRTVLRGIHGEISKRS